MHHQLTKIKTQRRISLWERFILNFINHNNQEDQERRRPVSSENKQAAPTATGNTNAAADRKKSRAFSIAPISALKDSTSQKLLSKTAELDEARKVEPQSQQDNKKPQIDKGLFEIQEKIRSYIVDEPEWRKNSRFLVKKFKSMFKKQYPGARKGLDSFFKRPFRRTGRLPYLSVKTGTIYPTPTQFPIVRSCSLQDFKDIKDKSHRILQRKLNEENYDGPSNTKGSNAEQNGKLPKRPKDLLVRSNSISIIDDIGRHSRLAKAIIPGQEAHFQSIKEFDNDENDSESMEDGDDEDSEYSDSDTYSDIDMEVTPNISRTK